MPAVLSLLLVLTGFSSGAYASRFYVRVTATGSGNGSGWGDASSNLQGIINAASSTDEVWVAGGTYQLASGQSFAMKEGVKIYGGFAGTEVNLTGRDLTITANKSILQGNGASVIVNNNNLLTNAALLDGFTITGASNAAGIANTSCSPTLVNLTISGNTAGGISNETASPVLIKCNITGNTASDFGGGIENTGSSPILTYCAITGNTAPQGGGIYNSASSPTLTNCTIGGNTGTGGMYNTSNSSPKLRNSVVSGNKSTVGNNSNIRNDFTSATAVKYSLVQNSFVAGDDTSNPADHNIPGDASAVFVDPAAGNYRLQLCSYGLNKGSNTYYANGQTPDLSALTTDLDGNPHFYNDGVADMGAYEYQGNPPTGVTGVSFVKVGGTGSGANWGCAAGNLQVAITSASSGEQVWVGGGTYQPTRSQSFNLKEGVKIYGNFNGTELALADRDLKLVANKSIMQGNNAMVIRNENQNLTTASLLDGFTITGSAFGPAINNVSSSPTLANLIITGNNYAGAMSNQQSSPVLINCAIIDNVSINSGAAMANFGSSPILINCTIAGNASSGTSAFAIRNADNSSLTVRNSIVYGNTRGTLLVGIGNEAGSTTVIKYSLVQSENNLNADDHNFPGNADPLFVDAATGNYRLQLCSPGINSGNKAFYANDQLPNISAFTTDLDGNARFYSNGLADMGAYEYQGDPEVGVAGVWYVKAGGTGSGKSWDCPIGSLEVAINVSKSGEQIWAAGGIYQPTRNLSFKLKEGVKIYGNFEGTEESLADRDLSETANKSTMQGNNARVIKNDGLNLTTAALLDGFTVTGSVAGPAIDNNSSSPMLANVIITGNFQGGALANVGSSPVLVNCAIIDNGSPANGAAVYNSGSSPVLINCTIAGNINSSAGVGIIYNTNSSSPKMRNSIVYGNETGIINEPGSSMDIQYSLVQGSAVDPANHNISGDTDPLFDDAANGNYQLKLCSPALNIGSNSFYASGQTPDISTTTTDLLGNPRFYNSGATDLGAYEYQGNPPTAGVAGVSYIKSGATGSGGSWDCAAGNVQVAINSAATGQQVWVAGGTYQPASGTAYSMKEGVKIYGGFAGTEASLTERNLAITTNKSILQANGSSVLINNGLTLTTASVLDGFTITGVVNAPAVQNLAGSSPMFANLKVTGNNGANSFGGIYIYSSSPVLINCAFTGNSSVSDGGGVLVSSASPILTNCLIAGNTANNGGGILISNSSVVMTNCTIVGNTATGQGAGICNYSSLISKLRNSIVYNNNRDNFNNANLSIEYSQVQGESSTSNHNIAGSTNPLFIDAAGGNYRLQPCSPLLNRGYNFFAAGQALDLTGITTDLDNNPRMRENGVDMGAYEFGGAARELALDGNEAAATVSGDLILTTNGSNCKILAYLSPNGGAPVNGSITAKVWIANSQPVNFLKRHYQITPATNAASATARVTLYFTQQEFTDFNVGSAIKLPVNAEDAENYKANLRIEKRSGTTNDGSGLPDSYTGSIATFKPSEANGNVVWNADANRWEVSFDVTGFSGFFVKTIESALPLHLISFTASKEAGSNLLQWSTASEVNTDNFEVQSSVNAKNFGKIAVVSAAGSGDHQYSYVDRTNYGGTIYYRLKMSDRDGTFTYSKIISLTGDNNFASVYPNPAAVAVTFQVSNALLKTTATLYDANGRKLQTMVITTGQQQINIRSLASGLYILKFADGTTERFVKE
ncbi:right-handed parallel beta-helix repeat-containing protein [Dyadobacter endophyticus]|uniref:right-handed parallel beta-helix repeat-containing protein n=1 Tax=Dyadobacter TaxID=120831 RepID=UPI003CEF0094